MTVPARPRWEDLDDRDARCPRCLHWWVSHGVPTEDGYGCGMPTSSMDERDRGIYEVCGCTFAEGNTVTRARCASGLTGPPGRSHPGSAPTAAARAATRAGLSALAHALTTA